MSPTDPADRDPKAWRGAERFEDIRTGAATRSVLERAHGTAVPYQDEDDELLTDERLFEEFRSREYTRVRVHYNCGVEANGRIKLFTQGHFWGGDDEHQRFKAQYRRAPPPTETVPFDTYEVWMRFQYGTVERVDGGTVEFRPDTERTGEELRELPYEELYTPVQQRLVELELVRNPPLARHVLMEQDRWEDDAAWLRYDPDAFDIPP